MIISLTLVAAHLQLDTGTHTMWLYQVWPICYGLFILLVKLKALLIVVFPLSSLAVLKTIKY